MTQDEIIEMAEQAGITIYSGEPWINDDDATDALQRFAKVVADKEREACAKWFEDIGLQSEADAIRARGERQ